MDPGLPSGPLDLGTPSPARPAQGLHQEGTGRLGGIQRLQSCSPRMAAGGAGEDRKVLASGFRGVGCLLSPPCPCKAHTVSIGAERDAVQVGRAEGLQVPRRLRPISSVSAWVLQVVPFTMA